MLKFQVVMVTAYSPLNLKARANFPFPILKAKLPRLGSWRSLWPFVSKTPPRAFLVFQQPQPPDAEPKPAPMSPEAVNAPEGTESINWTEILTWLFASESWSKHVSYSRPQRLRYWWFSYLLELPLNGATHGFQPNKLSRSNYESPRWDNLKALAMKSLRLLLVKPTVETSLITHHTISIKLFFLPDLKVYEEYIIWVFKEGTANKD